MGNEPIRVNVFKHGSAEFFEMLDESGIEYEQFQPFKPGTIVACADTMINLIGAVAGLGIPAALATVCVGWQKRQSSRKIIVTSASGEMIHAEGLSLEEFQTLIEQAKQVDIIQTQPDKKLEG